MEQESHMRIPTWLYDNLLAGSHMRREVKYIEKLEREHLQDLTAGRKHKVSKDNAQEIRSKWQDDFTYGDLQGGHLL